MPDVKPFWRPGELATERARATAERNKWDVYNAWHRRMLAEADARMSDEDRAYFHERALTFAAAYALDMYEERHADHSRDFVPDDWRSDWNEPDLPTMEERSHV